MCSAPLIVTVVSAGVITYVAGSCLASIGSELDEPVLAVPLIPLAAFQS